MKQYQTEAKFDKCSVYLARIDDNTLKLGISKFTSGRMKALGGTLLSEFKSNTICSSWVECALFIKYHDYLINDVSEYLSSEALPMLEQDFKDLNSHTFDSPF